LRIVPKSDLLEIIEPMETVGVRLELSRAAGPLATYEIDSWRSEAAGVVYERKPPEHATLELVFPSSGDGVYVGQAITILAASYRQEGYLRHVDFYDGDHVIG